MHANLLNVRRVGGVVGGFCGHLVVVKLVGSCQVLTRALKSDAIMFVISE